MVAPTFRGWGVSGSVSGTIASASLNVVPNAGDLLFMMAKGDHDAGPGVGQGFMDIEHVYNGVISAGNWWIAMRVCSGGDQGPYVATQGTIGFLGLVLALYDGALGLNPYLENKVAAIDHPAGGNPCDSNVLTPMTGLTPHIILAAISSKGVLGGVDAPFDYRVSDSGGEHIALADVLTDAAIAPYQAKWPIGTGMQTWTIGPYSIVGHASPPANPSVAIPPHNW